MTAATREKRALPLRILLLLAVAVLLGPGCVRVPAWQRGALADPRMQWDRHSDRAALRLCALSPAP